MIHKKFNKGDKVVLIDDLDLDSNGTELYGIYTVDSYVGKSDNLNMFTPLMVLDGINCAFAGERFISLMEYRRQKIDKIINTIDKR